MVSIDITSPAKKLLSEQCEVGTGAVDGLKKLLPKGSYTTQKSGLRKLTEMLNSKMKIESAQHFWQLLPKVEAMVQQHHKNCPGVLEQMDIYKRGLTDAIVQVQLCEWRQFAKFLRMSCFRKLGVSPKPGGQTEATQDGASAEVLCLEQENAQPAPKKYKRKHLTINPDVAIELMERLPRIKELREELDSSVVTDDLEQAQKKQQFIQELHVLAQLPVCMSCLVAAPSTRARAHALENWKYREHKLICMHCG